MYKLNGYPEGFSLKKIRDGADLGFDWWSTSQELSLLDIINEKMDFVYAFRTKKDFFRIY
jgi:hypothetical protein